MSRKTRIDRPLRRVVEVISGEPGGEVIVRLECGHQATRRDHSGSPYEARRCKHCPRGAR